MKRRKAGRPSGLTPEIQSLILKAIKSGMPNIKAAELVGISEQTFYTWKRRGENEKSGPYFRFVEELKKADAEFIKTTLDKINKVARGGLRVLETKETYDKQGKLVEKVSTTKKTLPNWLPAAWLLERKFPELFSRNRINVNEDVVDQLADTIHSLTEITEVIEE